MAQAKAAELKNLTADELNEKYETLKKDLFKLRLEAKLQKLTDASRIHKARRQIAQILTAKRELELKK